MNKEEERSNKEDSLLSSYSELERKEKLAQVGQVLIAFLVVWAFLFNLLVKKMDFVTSFFSLLDTLTEDLFMASGVSIVTACIMAIAYIVCTFYAQLLCAPASFRILEIWCKQEPSKCFLSSKELSQSKDSYVDTEAVTDSFNLEQSEPLYPAHWLLKLDDVRGMQERHPITPLGALLSLAFFYILTLIFVVLLSESIGILIQFTQETTLSIELAHMIPSLSLAIPLAVRMLAQFEYPHAKHFSFVIPLMMIVSIFYSALLITSQSSQPFLVELWSMPLARQEFIRTSMLVSFVPVFIEAIFWMLHIFSKQESKR
ncbi:MAG: hypothetical protein CMK59_08265 [Proteobacteria bacterium]|nr:hypothetical protein [Pseudomonadota bacterium]